MEKRKLKYDDCVFGVGDFIKMRLNEIGEVDDEGNKDLTIVFEVNDEFVDRHIEYIEEINGSSSDEIIEVSDGFLIGDYLYPDYVCKIDSLQNGFSGKSIVTKPLADVVKGDTVVFDYDGSYDGSHNSMFLVSFELTQDVRFDFNLKAIVADFSWEANSIIGNSELSLSLKENLKNVPSYYNFLGVLV